MVERTFDHACERTKNRSHSMDGWMDGLLEKDRCFIVHIFNSAQPGWELVRVRLRKIMQGKPYTSCHLVRHFCDIGEVLISMHPSFPFHL